MEFVTRYISIDTLKVLGAGVAGTAGGLTFSLLPERNSSGETGYPLFTLKYGTAAILMGSVLAFAWAQGFQKFAPQLLASTPMDLVAIAGASAASYSIPIVGIQLWQWTYALGKVVPF